MNIFYLFLFVDHIFSTSYSKVLPAMRTTNDTLECEFPPKTETFMRGGTHNGVRRKRLSTVDALVCLEDYPYTASVRFKEKHWCGGAIVHMNWVLSAAQCYDYTSLDDLTVRVGSVFRDFGGFIYDVIEMQTHPSYRDDQYYPENSIALLKVNQPFEVNPRVQIIQLPVDKLTMVDDGQLTVTGFGSVKGTLQKEIDQELRRMIVRELDKPKCRLIYGNEYYLQYDNICLTSIDNQTTLCEGDTGDPVVYFDNNNTMGILYGIAIYSGAEPCTKKTKPGVYTKILNSIDWINEVLSTKTTNKKLDSNAIDIDDEANASAKTDDIDKTDGNADENEAEDEIINADNNE